MDFSEVEWDGYDTRNVPILDIVTRKRGDVSLEDDEFS